MPDTSIPDGERPDTLDRFDYIIVGSGAGGGPLAARLASYGHRVLVIEAGPDALVPEPANWREVSLVPSFHGLSTEHPALSWEFFVEHYAHPPGPDPKRSTLPSPRNGIFYPRASALGGCTVHNAMIIIAGPDSDWDDLADFVDDDSWRGSAMRAYFGKLERNEYSGRPTAPPTSWFGRARDLGKWLFGFDPDHTRGGHGFTGWLHTSVTDLGLGLFDWQLVRMLKGALRQAKRAGLDRAWTIVFRFLKGRIKQVLDPNHARTQAESPEGVVLVPLSVCGAQTTIHQNAATPFVIRGRRSSPRELLLEAKAAYPDNLTIWTDTLVTRVLFAPGDPPRAIGVEYHQTARLYRAHKRVEDEGEPALGEPRQVFVAPLGEVVLSGGAFNTPQLLMLSGIGDRAALEHIAKGHKDTDTETDTDTNRDVVCALRGADGKPLDAGGVPLRIHSPGVGKNLQDRYEISLVSRMHKDFSLLDGATFALPADAASTDRHLKEWRAEGIGLYTSNGAVLGIFKRSNPDLDQPDLFIFGLPFEFRGYELGYSEVKHHNRFTWAILKGHTRNGDGTVRLRSADPRDTPLVNFHYFNEKSQEGRGDQDPDVTALVDGVRFVRGIIRNVSGPLGVVAEEVYPKVTEVPDDDDAIKAWIRREAWGHHTCGTCRMGPDADPEAVLDSRFRVRGVTGLRVVDASVFPRIPGYFIVANVYMASEKAADVLHEDRQHGRKDDPFYPRELRVLELEAVRTRRIHAGLPPPFEPSSAAATTETELDGLPDAALEWRDDVTGLALSGGGIRSATVTLGLLQALASRGRLRGIDLMSTVSGGGYTGAFLGRWFARFCADLAWGGRHEPKQSATDRIERELTDPRSPAMDWLRRHGNYIAPTGEGDARLNWAVFLRGLVSVHFVVGIFVFVLFGLGNLFRYGVLSPGSAAVSLATMDAADLPLGHILKAALGVFYSPWFVVFELVLLVMVLPRIVGYWIVSQDRHGRFSFPALLLMFMVTGALLYAGVRDGFQPPFLVLGLAPYASLVSVELAWRRGRIREQAIGRGNVETQRLRTRNYLTYDLGLALAFAGASLAFALIDTIGHALHQTVAADNARYWAAVASLMAGVAALGPVTKYVAGLFTRGPRPGPPSTVARLVREQAMAAALAVVLITLPLILVSFVSHVAFDGGQSLGAGGAATALAVLVSVVLAIPSALVFVNRSSLAQTYAARLARAYLGASNPARRSPQAADVTEVMAGDDLASLRDYEPFRAGGPLHLINVAVNQTVDFNSQRGNRDRKADNVAVSSIGMSIGRRWHSAWADAPGATEVGSRRRKKPQRLVPLGHQPGLPHPLVDEAGLPASRAEMLSLRQWMAISGAALGPGRGQTTQLGTALLFGLANLRTGYWWDCGITEAARAGFPPLTLLQRVLYILQCFFLTQTLLLFEWVARFPGPWERFWFLSDGAFFERTGAYELIRRRVPRIIVCDASADPRYQLDSVADLMRKVRIDFHADLEPVPPSAFQGLSIPEEMAKYLGTLEDLQPPTADDGEITGFSQKHAVLFRVNYHDAPTRRSLLLYIKASLTGDEALDILNHHTAHREFPHEGTADQSFDEAQWESYRGLGQHMASPLIGDWFWNVPL